MSTLSQILHIVAKDARRFWPLAALVVAVLGLDLVLEPVSTPFIRGNLGYFMGGLGVRGIMFGLMTILVATLIVHEDEVASGQAFWSSRPIAPQALLGAKVLLVGMLLLVVPLVFQGVAMAEAGGDQNLLPFLAESALYQGGLLALVMAVAAVTKDLKATLILGIVGYVAMGTLTSMWWSRAMLTGVGLGADVIASRDFVGRAWWLLAGGAVLAHQFMTGRNRTAMTALVLVVSATALISARMPYDITTPDVTTVELAEGAAPVELRQVNVSPSVQRGQRARDGLDLVFGTPDSEYALEPRMSSLAVSFTSDGEVEELDAPGFSYRPVARYLPELEGYEWIGVDRDAWAQFEFRLLSLPSAELSDAVQEIGEVEVRTEWDAFTRRVVGRLPLEVGAELTEGPARVRVERVELLPTSAAVNVTTTWIRSALDPSSDVRADRIRMVFVNDRLEQVLMVNSGGTSTNHQRLLLGGPRVARQSTGLNYVFGTNPDLVFGLDADWFADASVLVFANEYVGTYSDVVTVDASDWGPVAVASGPDPGAQARYAAQQLRARIR